MESDLSLRPLLLITSTRLIYHIRFVALLKKSKLNQMAFKHCEYIFMEQYSSFRLVGLSLIHFTVKRLSVICAFARLMQVTLSYIPKRKLRKLVLGQIIPIFLVVIFLTLISFMEHSSHYVRKN